MMSEKPVSLRMIQHYMYCPRRFALLELNQDWAENAAVVNANILHETVHSDKPRYMPKGVIAENSVTVWNDEYSLLGVCDCVEFVPDKNGIEIAEHGGRYRVRLVEFKLPHPKARLYPSDAIRLRTEALRGQRIGMRLQRHISTTPRPENA